MKVARPKADPLMLKRSLENGNDQKLSAKKQKSDGDPSNKYVRFLFS